MTQADLDQRVLQRSIDERLHTVRLAGDPLYLVRARKTEPGAMHQVRINGWRAVTSWSCQDWVRRPVCNGPSQTTGAILLLGVWLDTVAKSKSAAVRA